MNKDLLGFAFIEGFSVELSKVAFMSNCRVMCACSSNW